MLARRLLAFGLLLASLGGLPAAARAQVRDLTYASQLNAQEIPIKVFPLHLGFEAARER